MEKLTIPLYIPKKDNELDYQGLMNIINDIDDCNILIGDYNLNKLSDLDYIKDCSGPNSPVLVVSYSNWMYLHLERPMATYSTWYKGTIDPVQLIRYYRENSGKKPKYIYYETSDFENPNIQLVNELFNCTSENLSNGIHFTVESYNF